MSRPVGSKNRTLEQIERDDAKIARPAQDAIDRMKLKMSKKAANRYPDDALDPFGDDNNADPLPAPSDMSQLLTFEPAITAPGYGGDGIDPDLQAIEQEQAARDAADVRARSIDTGRRRTVGGDIGLQTRAVVSPIADSMAGSESIPQYRIFELPASGKREYIGLTSTGSTPEFFIDEFPLCLPEVGKSKQYIFKGLDSAGRDTTVEIPFTISGNNPRVIEARKRALPPGGDAAVGLTAMFSKMVEQSNEKEARLELERRDMAAAERARMQTEMDREFKRTAQSSLDQRDWLQRASDENMARIRADLEKADQRARADLVEREAKHRMELELVRDQRAADRADAAAERQRERDERDRRDRLDREDRDRKDTLEKEVRAAERERQREHDTRMAALTAAGSLESTIGKITPMLAAFGLDPAKLIGKFLGGDKEEGGMSPSTGAAIAGVVTTIVEQIGAVVTKQQELQARLAGADEDDDEEPGHVVQQRQLPQRPPPVVKVQLQPAKTVTAPAAKPVPAPAVAPVATPAPATPETAPIEGATETSPATQEAPAVIIPLPVKLQKSARIALRDLAEQLRDLPHEQWQALIIKVCMSNPSTIAYMKSVGVKAAVIEAGLSEEQADVIAEKAKGYI